MVTRIRSILTSLAEIAGAGLVVYGISMFSVGAAVIVAGLLLIAGAVLAS